MTASRMAGKRRQYPRLGNQPIARLSVGRRPAKRKASPGEAASGRPSIAMAGEKTAAHSGLRRAHARQSFVAGAFTRRTKSASHPVARRVRA